MPVPKLLVTAALAGAYVALGMTKRTEGQRLDELDVSVADFGTPLPRFWGIRRFECPIIWAEKLREKKKTSKTKGGKYTEYKYYGTWAVAVADNEIDSVSRIWLDRHLAYDTTGVGPITPGLLSGDDSIAGKLGLGLNMRIYLGTEDQESDPRITSWCEDRYGANTAPAYKGVAYIVFQDIPLEKFGNRIPQISVEAIHTKNDAFPYSTALSRLGDTAGLRSWAISQNGAWLFQQNLLKYDIWDVATRTRLGGGDVPTFAFLPTSTRAAISNDGAVHWYSTAFPNFVLYSASISGVTTSTVCDGGVAGTPEPTRIFRVNGGDLLLSGYSAGGYFQGTSLIEDDRAGRDFCADANGDVWGLFQTLGSSNEFEIKKIAGGLAESHVLTGPATRTGPSDAVICYSRYGKFCILMDGYFITVDPTTWAVTSTALAIATPFLPYINGSSFWLNWTEYSLEDGSVIRTVDPTDWGGLDGGFSTVYDPINNALISGGLSGSEPVLVWRYLDRVGSDGVTLQTVIDDVADWCGLSGQDTSALTQTVEGYSVTQGSGKDMIAPLLDVHDVDPRPHDFQIQFVNRGSSAAGTITTSELAREGDENRYVASIVQDTDLPRKITFNFADKDHDQQANNVIAQRPLDAVDATREQTIDLGTYVSTPAIAQKFADRYLRRQWIGRETFTLSLTAQRLALEPADVWNLELDGVVTSARLTKVTLSGGKLNTEWERDYPSIATVGTGAGADMGGRNPETVYIPGPTKGFVKDIPLLSDNDNNVNPLLYYGAGPFSSSQNWPGAYIMQGDPDGADYDIEWNALDSSRGSQWGFTTDALDDVTSPWVWDRGNTVNVQGNLSLTSVTEAEIDAEPLLNMALLGDELINFATATLESDGSYTLSTLKRGRRGTEWATSDHSAGEEFVLVSELLNEGEGLSEVGTELSFKVQTLGRPIDAAPAIDIDFAGRSLMPYAPARLKTYYDGTDLQCTIIRRTRVGGAWTGGSTIPLSENSEEYEVEVYNGLTLKRTVTVSGTNTFTYTAAQATADGFTLPTQPTFHVYQLSDAVGRGFALAA